MFQSRYGRERGEECGSVELYQIMPAPKRLRTNPNIIAYKMKNDILVLEQEDGTAI